MVERIKKIIAPLYGDLCSVYEKTAVVKDCRTGFEECLKYENIPCRISAKTYLFGESAASDKGEYLKVSKKVKLFFPPEYDIKPGSRIEVVSKGRKFVFSKSSMMSCFYTHNEVMAELECDYA